MRPFLIALFLAQPLSAETRQHGNLIFDLPQGWTLGAVQEDGSRLLLTDLPDDLCEYCRVYITPGTAAPGPVDDWLGDQTRRFIDAEETPQITPMTASEVFNLKGRPAAMLGQKVDDDLQMLVAVQLFGRIELVAFTAPAHDEAEVTESMGVFQRDVVPMIEAARFVSEGATPVMPPPEPGGLEGLWWGTSTWWSMGLDGMMTMQIDHHWLTFHPDGTFYDGTPPTGLQTVDQAGLLAVGDMDWGSYRQEGDDVILSYASGEVARFRAKDDRMTNGDLTVAPTQPLPDGTRIDGMVSTFFYSGFTPGIGISGGMSSATETRFHPDGSWDFGSSSGAFGSFEQGGGFATSGGGEARGRYEVRDGVVIRTDSSGAVVGRAWIFKDGTDIWIGSEVLKPG